MQAVWVTKCSLYPFHGQPQTFHYKYPNPSLSISSSSSPKKPTKIMVMQIVLVKLLHWFLYQLLANSCYKAAIKVKSYGFFLKNPSQKQQPQHPQTFPSLRNLDFGGIKEDTTLVCDMHGCLLRSKSFFPYLMLVAFEGGSIFRALALLCSCPLLCFLDYDMKLRVMIFVSFCGMRVKAMESLGRAVMPKFYLENLNPQACEVLGLAGSKVVFTSVPRVLVEGFLREYLEVDDVVGTELGTLGGYFTGFVSGSGLLVKHRAVKDYFGDLKPDVGFGSSSLHDHLFLSQCKEAYVVNATNTKMPREKYPKPLIFHDGRLAFFPTPQATLAMFMWLPLGIIVAIFRISIGVLLPYTWARSIGIWTGVDLEVIGSNPKSSNPQKGVLYVCNHRTLLDPVMLSTALAKPLTAVTYSLSKMSEVIAPIRTVRLTRDRAKDGEAMERLLREGDLVVCPEGTTCREPYLLRFSSLFAELAEDIVPVAVDSHVTMFYGTTASGLKCLDPLFFFMNPLPKYHLQILGKLPRELTFAGGKSSCDVANYIQSKLACALGFECTSLTRRDKYLMLAGNEGLVQDHSKRK